MSSETRLILCFLLLINPSLQAQQEYYGHDALRPIISGQTDASSSKIQLPGNIIINGVGISCIDIGDDKGSTKVALDQNNFTLATYDYCPYGYPVKTSHNGSQYTGTYIWDIYTRLYRSPSRKYDPLSKRFLSVDRLEMRSDKYNYTYGNPINQIDVNGAIVMILYPNHQISNLKSLSDWYHIVPDYTYTYMLPSHNRSPMPVEAPSFVKDVTLILDELHNKGAANIKYPATSQASENVIERLVNADDHIIRIVPFDKTKTLTGYDGGTVTSWIGFDGTALAFKKESMGSFIQENAGFHSPMLGLLHETIHSYLHELSEVFSSDEEEELVTQLTNQGALKLGEDIRPKYGAASDGAIYHSIGPKSIEIDRSRHQPLNADFIEAVFPIISLPVPASTDIPTRFWRPWE